MGYYEDNAFKGKGEEYDLNDYVLPIRLINKIKIAVYLNSDLARFVAEDYQYLFCIFSCYGTIVFAEPLKFR